MCYKSFYNVYLYWNFSTNLTPNKISVSLANSRDRKQNLNFRIYVDHIRRGETAVVRGIRPTQIKSKQGLFYESSDLHTSFHTVFTQCFHKKPFYRHLFILPLHYIPRIQTNLTYTCQCSHCAVLLK